jgi:hypothetical protein
MGRRRSKNMRGDHRAVADASPLGHRLFIHLVIIDEI